MSKSCNDCRSDTGCVQVPYLVHESAVSRMERVVKRQWIALIVAIAVIFCSNAIWLYAWMQYDYTSEEMIIDVNSSDGGNANYIGNNGDIINGTSESYKEITVAPQEGR